MSISELISELRDSFIKRDFDRVEEALIARETRLKAEIEDKKREILLLNEEVDFQRIEKMSVEVELMRVKEQMLKDGGDIACAVAEMGNVRVSAASETLMEATLKSAIEEKVGEITQNNQFKNWGKLNFDIEVQINRVEKRGEEFKVAENSKVVKTLVGQEKCKFGVHDGKACTVGELGKKDGPYASGNDFDPVEETLVVREVTMAVAIEDKMKEIRLLHEKMVKGEKCATVEVKDEKVDVLAEEKRLAGEPSKKAGLGSSGNWRKNSSVVQKNLTTGLAEPAGVIKRDFVLSGWDVANFLDGLDTVSSSSSSSSSSGEFDISPFTSVKRTKLS